MNNSQLKKKILTVVVFALAFFIGICTFFGINASLSGDKYAGASSNNFGVLNSAAGDDDVDFTYEFGKSYTINGKTYTISNAKQEDYIPFPVALELSDTVAVTRDKFYDVNGVDKTGTVGGIRSAGLYELTVNGTGQKYKVRVLPAKLDYSTTDVIPVFVNANSKEYRAHGDNTAVYKHNDGWYPSQKANEVPVEIRTITNAYYYLNNPTDQVTIKIGNEQFTDADGNPSTDVTSAFSTLAYNNLIDIKITDRAGVQYRGSNEYIATFTFNAPENCLFDYGDAGEDDEITDVHKGISITQRTPTSFVLVKHWFLVNYTSLFVSQIEPTEEANGLKETNDPYVPFHDKQKFDNYLDSLGKPSTWVGEGQNGESDTGTDTITYGDDLHVKTPGAKFRGEKYGTIKFDVIYVDLDGKTHKLVTGMQLGTTNTATTQRLDYYFNKTMPAGKYTLKLFGEINASQIAASEPNQIRGEYWLTVLPAPLNSSLITGANGIHNAIKGTLQSNGEFINSYLLSENMLHKDLSNEITALNNSLNGNLGTIDSYWNDKSQYFENAVTVKYNRDTWSSSNYVTYNEINQMITQAGNYTLYYSIAVKNYVTVGGPDDANRTDYGFVTRLSAGVSIKQIYDRVYTDDDPYFKNVTYTGNEVHTLVPQSQQYTSSFNDKDGDGNANYVNVRTGATVTLALYDITELLTGWENDVVGGDLGDRIELSDDKRTLTVSFDIVPATNTFTVAPQMSPWTYGNYKQNINFITDGLAFDGTDVYYRIGKRNADDTYTWTDVGGDLTVEGETAPEFFTVNENGEVSEAVAAKLNELGAGTYYICGYINPSREVNGTYNVSGRLMQAQGYTAVVVMQASNSWDKTPYIIGWMYDGFVSENNFQAGEAVFGKDRDVTYSLYEGTSTTGTPKATFTAMTDDVAATLKGLDAKTYTLVASLGGTANYTDLSLRMTFAVAQATNSWKNAPYILDWAYNGFAASNFNGGEARFIQDDEQITYTLKDGDGETRYTFNALSDVVENDEGENSTIADELNDLDVGTYTLIASLDGTGSYGDLQSQMTFVVYKATNAWTMTPFINSWAYQGFTDNNVRAGVAKFGSQINYTLYEGATVTASSVVMYTFTGLTDTITVDGKEVAVSAMLHDLPAKEYTIVTSVDDTDNYGGLSMDITFVVYKASNTWTTTPVMTGWVYKLFSESNFQAGVTGLGEKSTITYKLYEGATTTNLLRTLAPLTDDLGLADADITYFKDLARGTYTLVAHQVEAADYGELSQSMTFSVTKATNTWTTTPYVTGWTYKQFTANNFQEGVTEFGEKNTVTYKLYKGNKAEGDVLITFGSLNDDGVIDYFKALGCDTYTLSAYQIESESYYDLSTPLTFAVTPTTNSWVTRPRVIDWAYGSFDNSYFIAGVPTFQESTEDEEPAVVRYTLKKDGDDGVTPVEFTTLADAGFASLGAGSYTISVSYVGTDNYATLTDTVEFTVGKYTNSWNPSPSLRGWSYKNFTASLFTAGVPTMQDDEDAVVIYKVTGDTLTQAITLTVNNGALSDASVDVLTALAAGSYTLTATYPKTDNYDGISATYDFTVSKIDNGWATRPRLLGWTYGAFESSYFIAGVPTLTDGNSAKVQYTLTKDDDSNFTAVTFTADTLYNFASLNAGSYTLKVSYAGTNNYTELDADDTVITFAVSAVTNTWDTQPTITGFVYKQFTEVNSFVAGVPHYPLSDKQVYYVIARGAIAEAKTLTAFQAIEGEHFDLADTAMLNATVVNYFNGLAFGKYYFAVFVPEADNYTYLFYTGSFNVSQTSNYWKDATPPDISGWIYGAFADSLFKSGTPMHGTATYTVYIVDSDDVAEVDGTPLSGLSYTALKAKLNGLNADTYIIRATSGVTNEYAEATWSKQFVVAKADNEWATAPSISGWTYGETPATSNNGTAKYEADITGKYYPTTTDSNGNLKADTSKAPMNAVEDAGSYAYVLTVADTTNYNGFTTTLFFTVAKADNDWTTSPAGSYNWAWGDDISTLTNNIVNAAANHGTVSFDIVKTGGGAIPTGTISEILEALTVGEYTVTVTVTTDNNHVAVDSAVAYVTVGNAQLKVNTEPACAGWTWGTADANKVFTNIAVTPAKEDDNVTVQYRVSDDGGDTWTNYLNTPTSLMNNIKDRAAGDYVVEVTASCANHESVTRTVSFTIANASLIWSDEPNNVSWEWNDKWTAGGRVIPNLTAKGCNNVAAALSYTINGTAYADFDAVESYLQSNERNAGTYNVKVTAKLANHNDDEITFTVTVNQAENEWTTELESSYSMSHDALTTITIPTPSAKHGVVIVKYGDTPINDINVWLAGLSANSTPYVLTLSVTQTGNYKGLSKEVSISIASVGSEWDNKTALSAVEGATDITASYNFTYDKNVFDTTIKATVVFPEKGSDAGTTKYSLYLNDTLIDTYTALDGATGLRSYFSSDRTAGTYKVVAAYNPKNDNYSSLTYTVTIVVEKDEVDWSDRLEQSYAQIYDSVSLPNPAANKDFATVTVAVKKNNVELDMKGKSLSEFVSTLDVGTYTITATIDESENYTVKGEQIISVLVISAIQNAWTDITKDGKTITAEQWANGYTWEFTRGDDISVMLPQAVKGDVKVSFNGAPFVSYNLDELNELLNNDNGRPRAAGNYTLIFRVDADEKGNYIGLVSNCAVVINKKGNDWTQELQSYTGSGSVDTTEFTLPVADVYQINNVDLRIYNIVKAGARPNSDWYTEEDFLSELGKLANGTYTITARIGGDYRPATADDSFIQARNLYNDDYEAMVCSCTVTLTPSENAWTTKLSDISWTWGDTVNVTLAVADFGNDQIVYTISAGGVNTITIKTSECDDVQTALDNAVNDLRYGTYTIAATIAGTDLYATPTESNVAILTVSKYVASWDTEEDLSEYSLLHMTWNQAANDLLPTLSVKCMNGSKVLVSGAVVWKIGDYQPADIILALNGLAADTYVVTATYAGDEYNEGLTFTATVIIDKVQTAWDAATTANNGKVYNWILLGTNEAVKQPVLATTPWGKTVEYKLQSGSSDLYTGSSWSGLTTELNKCKAGEYTITAHIDGDDNHTALDYSVTVNIGQSANGWTAELNGGTWTWGEHATVLNALTKPNAAHGNDSIVFTVKNGATTKQTIRVADYEDLDTAFAELKTYLGGLSVGTYTVTVSIAATADYVAPTDTTVVFIVNIVTTAWNAATTANNGKVYNWVLGGTNEAVAQPVLGTPAWGETAEYKLAKGSTDLYTGSSWNGLVTALGNCKAGEYTITAHIDGDTNHTALDYSVTVNISAKANSWTEKTGNGNSTAKEIEKTFGDDMSFIKFTPAFGASTLVVTVNGKATNDVVGYINSNGAGEYLIVASVDGTDEYGALVDTVRLTVAQAADTFGTYNVPASWAWDDVSQKTDVGGIAWQTEWNTALTVPVPAVNTTATAIVYGADGTTEQFAATLHYETTDGVKNVLVTDLNALKSKLLGLHVGTYTIEFVVGNSVNYKGCKVSATFNVTKATNAWDGSDGVPKIAGWQYDGSVANPTATPKYGKGTVKFSYAKAGTETKDQLEANDSIVTWKDSTDTAEGTYWLRAYVQGTDDYSSLVGYVKFNISAGQNGWVNNPGVIAWNWNGYNKTVNLFSGSAKNNGEATFKIYAVVGGVDRNLGTNNFVFNGQAPENTDDGTVVALFNTNGFKLVEENGVMVVSDEVAQWLNALKPATYKLSVVIAADNNYDELSGSATFTVGKATNSWATGKAPAVSSYTYLNYNKLTTFTYGETVYGSASDVIYMLGDETFTTNASKPAYVQLQEYLANLGAGSYTLSAWVPESANGTYSALYSSGSPYTTRSFTVARAANDWENNNIVTQIDRKYSEIKADTFTQTKFAELYAQLTPIEGTVTYALLNADYTSRATDELDYEGLFNAIKALPAGEYVIRATVAEATTTNYLGIGATDTRLIISSHDNAFTQIPDSLTAHWACGLNEDNETVNKTVLDAFEVEATYGTSTVTYTFNKTTYESYAEFEEAVSALNAGSYNVTIAIAATDDYAGLSEVRMLTVTQGQNSWQNDWAASGSLSVADGTTRSGLSWDWKTTITWTKAEPVYGNTVYVEIRKANASSALQYVTLDYGVDDGTSAVSTISEAISRLDVGNYELIVSAPATVNWAALSDKVEFSINKVTNSWDKAPQIGGANGNKWAHGTNAVPDADAKYGEVRYEYETKSGDKLTSMPTSAGEYVIKFIVDGTVNYDGISGSLNVTIGKATNRTVAMLGVYGWTWGAYDREINLITGTPEITELENASVKFSIGTGLGDNFVALPDLAEFTLTANGLVERDSKVEAALRALTGGTSKDNNITYYTVRIHVGETTNYNGFTADNMFTVTGATNTFAKYPTIKPWEVNHWTDELPSAVAMYGKPEITIKGETDGVTYFKGEYKENADGQLELVVELNDLNLAPKGEYVLTATVKAVAGQYNSPLVGEYKFNIDVKGAGQANYWEELPTIDGWIANIDGLFNAPTGKPVRGLPNFVFYVRNEDGTRGQKVDASLTDVVLKKGSKYEADIYIPVEYGDYILVASSKGIPDAEGKSDALAEYEIRVIIDPRPLSFEQELRIPTLLYLGDRKDWTDPTSKPSLDDAEITYVYTNKETGVSSTEMPTIAGEYTVTATLSAKYSNSVSMSVDFTVKLSPNGWTAAPNIKDWSEESDGNLPTGAATVGTDQIVYTYASVKEPNKILKERPTTEGSYIMYADIDVAGYEPLHAEYRFTIEPAFDTQLVIAAIVLGVFACALACVVIYFAIKRYKEN